MFCFAEHAITQLERKFLQDSSNMDSLIRKLAKEFPHMSRRRLQGFVVGIDCVHVRARLLEGVQRYKRQLVIIKESNSLYYCKLVFSVVF